MIDQRAIGILDEVRRLLERVRAEEVDQFHRLLVGAPRVFAFATGRSGFVLSGFIMRLNHLGHPAYLVGEASTPPVQSGDLFVVMSGSGTTATTLGAAMEAAKIGAHVAALVGSRLSPLGQLAAALIELPAPHKRGLPPALAGSSPVASSQTAGSLFEQTCYILLESVILRRFQELGQDPAAALVRHANLEV